MKQFQQISIHECELTMRHVLCQDVIFQELQIQNQQVGYVDTKREQK